MADTAVTERRIRPVQDAIEANNWKQALKECEKWHKKGESSDRFLVCAAIHLREPCLTCRQALKAAVLLQQPDDKNKQKGATETLELCRRQSPVLNVDAIHQLQESLSILKLDSVEGPKLWERAVTTRPSDKDLITKWLNNSISASNWQSAQKATMALRKAFPKDRQYDFWNIIMCYLIHEDVKVPEKDRKMFGLLANRMISKAAQAGPADKIVSNPEELSLLVAVLSRTGSVSELCQLLTSELLQKVCDQDRAYADSLLFDSLAQVNDDFPIRESILPFLKSSKDSEPPSSDDRVWKLLVATNKSPDALQESLTIADDAVKVDPKHRPAMLTRIDLLAQKADDMGSELMSAYRTYYNAYGTKAFCFDDLISRLPNTHKDLNVAIKDLLQVEPQKMGNSSIAHGIFALKMLYFCLFTVDCGSEQITAFILQALQLYTSAANSGEIVAEAALIAAMALLRLSVKVTDTSLLLSVNLILNSVCNKFKDYYPLRVLLLRVQLTCGQIHLAMENFLHLSIKNLQFESAGHLLLERISTLHPCQHGHGEDSLNPAGALDAALTVARNSQRSLDRAIRDGLRNGSYSNVLDTVALRGQLQRSMTRQMYLIEQRKIQRALNQAIAPKFEPLDSDLIDLRDSSFMPDYGLKDETISELLSCGPRPAQAWVSTMSLHECLTTYIAAQVVVSPAAMVEAMVENLRATLTKTTSEAKDLSRDEQVASSLYQLLATSMLDLFEGKPQSVDEFKEINVFLDKLKEPVEAPAVDEISYPDSKWLHHQFVRLEVLSTIAQYSAAILKKAKTSKDKKQLPEELRNECERLWQDAGVQAENVHSQARKLKQGLSAPGVLGKLVDASLRRQDGAGENYERLGEQIAALQDEIAVEEYCGRVRESWEDALDNVLAVKIKTS